MAYCSIVRGNSNSFKRFCKSVSNIIGSLQSLKIWFIISLKCEIVNRLLRKCYFYNNLKCRIVLSILHFVLIILKYFVLFTQELKDYEEKILTAESKIQVIENRLYTELMLAMTEYVAQMQQDAAVVAQLDCLMSFATAAVENRYVCPDINDSMVVDIRQGRHPVIEKQLPKTPLPPRFLRQSILYPPGRHPRNTHL